MSVARVRKTWEWFILIFFLAVLILSGCNPQSPDSLIATQADGPRIEVDIFSGRPNPRMEIESAVVEDISRQVTELQSIDPTAVPEHMGYRGLLVILNGETVMRLYDGLVFVNQGDALAYYSDPGRNLEMNLLKQIQSELDPALFDEIINGGIKQND